ncbi:unnamed protein product [Timema podura]|uniref:Ig-like domain-containing protein n=1 Tax=Timema podura TaxID=61482 RepID=A0ABN7NBM1_TIMPD|nr:unnamed protein product [Timema podura]
MEGPQFGNQLKQLYVELYIKAITTELNTAIIAEEDQGVSRINAGLSKSYINFANLVYEYKEIRRECIITAFSLNPTVECLELLKNSANENLVEGEEHNITRENSKVNELPICDLHPPYIISNKSHGELCSQCGEFTGMKKKKLKRMPEGVVDGQDVIEDETESETESGDPYTYFIKVLEPLQLTKDLCHDFISILQNPRDKSFKVIADGTELESICYEYLNYKRTILKELKYLTIDYKVFDGIPRQEEGTGIEKGYEDFLDSTDSSCKLVHKDDVPPVSKRGKPKANEKRIVKATKMKENEDQYYQWSDSSEHSVSDSDATYIPHSKDISTLDSDYSSGNTKKSKKMSISRNHSNLGSIDLNIQSNINFQNEREINLSTPELTPDSDILHSDLSHISPSYTPVEETDPIENTNFNTEELSGESQFNECVREPKFDYPEEVPELDEVATEFHGHFLAPMFYSPDLIPSTDTGLSNSIIDLTALDDSIASSPNPSYSPDNTQNTVIEGFTHSSMKANNLEDQCKSLPALVKYGSSDKNVENVSHKNGSCDEFNNHILKLSNSKCIPLKVMNTNKETFRGALRKCHIKEKELNAKNQVLDPFENPIDSLNNKNSPKYSKMDSPDDILDNTVLSNNYNSSAEGIQTDTGEYNMEHISHNSPMEITVIDNFNVGTSFDCDSALDETDIDGDYNNQHYMLNVTNVELTVPSNANTQNSQLSSNLNSEPPQTSEVNSPSQVALCSEDKSTSQSNSTIPVDSAQFAQSSTSEDFERLSSSTVSQNQSQESDKSLRNKISNQVASLPKFQHAFRKTVYQGNTSSIGESSDTLSTSQEIPDSRSKFIENKSQSANISQAVKTEPQNITTLPNTVLSKAVQTGICNIVSQASSSNAAIVGTGTHPNIHPSTSLGVQKRILNSAKETNDLSLEVIESTSNVCGIISNPISLKNSSSSQSGNVLTSGNSLAVQGETFLTHTVKISASSCSTNLTTTQSEPAPEVMLDKPTDDEPSPTTSKSITPKSTVKKICLQIVQRGNIQQPVQSGQNKKSSNDVSGCSIISQTNVPILQNTAGEPNGTLRQQLVQSVLVSCLSSSSTNGSGDGNLSQNANPSDTLIAQSPLEPTVSSTTLEQLREFESVLEQVTNTSQMKERGSNCQQPHTRSQTILSPQLLITQQQSSNVHSNFISSDVPTSFSQNLFSAASTSSLSTSVSSASIPSSSSRVHVAYVSQSQTVRSNNISSSNARISSTPVVVVTSYCQPVASPALSVTSQSSSSPCVTPAPIPSSSSTKSSKAKSSKSKSGKTSTSTATSRPSPVPRPQQKPQEDEQTAQRIYAILDEYAEQLRNSPDLKNKPAPRRRSNPPTNPNHSSKRKKSAQTKVKLLGQQSSSTAPEMSPGADDPRTFGSEDSSSGVTQLSHIQDSPAPSTQSADEMGSLRENSSLDASIEAGNLKSVVSDGGDVQGNCQPHRLIFTDANTMQGRAVILHDSVQTISDVTATSSNTSVKPVMMSNTATAVYVPSGLRQVFLPMAPGLTASVQGRPVVVSKGSKVIRVHQVTVPTSLQMSSGTSAVQGAALVVRQMCVKPSVSVATSVSVLNQTTVKQVKLPVGSISSQALSGVSAQPPVVLQPGSHQLAGPIASVETTLPHTISFSEPTTQVTKSNVQTDFSRRDKTSVVALDGGVSRPSMLGLIHRGMPVTFQDQLTIPIGETATSLSLHSHDRLVLPNIAQISPSSINDVIVTKKYGTKNVTSDTQHKKSWDCIVTVDDKVSTILTNVAQKSNQQPEDDLSRKALQSSDLNFCSNAMEYTSPNRETSLIDVEYPMQNGSHEITVSISKTNIGDASSLETVKCESPLESKKSCTVTRQLPKYSPKSVLKSDDNVSSDLIGLLCNTPLKHDQAQFEKDDTSNHHTSQSHQRSSNNDGIFGNPNERSLCTSPFTAKMTGTLVSHDELAGEENLFSSVNSSVPASVTVRSPCAFDKFPKNIGQIMDQQIENFRHNSNNNSNSNSSSSDSILRCVAPDHGGSTIVSQGEGLGNPNQSKVGLLCKSSMSTLDCGNEIGYNMRPRVQQLGYANVSSYHLPTKMTLHKGGQWRYVPIVKKVKMPFRTVILQKDSEDAVMMMGHPGSSVNLTDITSEVEDSSQENRTYLPDGKDSVVRKHNADHSLLSYHKLESSQQFEKSNDLLALQQKARVERELRLQKSLSEECEDLGVDEPSTSDLFPEADLLLDTNSSPSFDQTLQDASCSQSLESAEHYPNANFRPLEYSSSSQESEQESRLKRQVKLDSKLQNETKHTAYKLNDELSEWQFETTKELKSKTIGESTREKKSKCRGNVLKRRSLDADPKAVPMKRSLIGSTNEKPNDSHSHVMNEHLKISCNSIHTEIVSEKLANKTTRSINDTQSLSSNNTVTVASPGESSFSSSSEESVTLLDSYTNNVVPLDVTVPICSPLPSQSNNISESKDLLPSVTQSVYTYSRIAGKGSKFIKGKDLKCTNQYLVNHLDSQELWDTSSSQERTVVDDEDSESLSRTEDLTSSPPDQSNSDVEIVELSNDSSHYSCVSYSHIPLMKLVVPRLEEILGVNNRSNGLDHIDSTTANCVGDVMANKIHGTRNFFLNRSNIESQLKSSNQNFENKNTSLGRSSKRKLNIEEEPLSHGKRPKTDHSIFSQSSVQKEDAVTVSNIISSNRRIPAASCETSVQSRSQVAVSGCSGEGPCVVQMSSSRLLRRSSLRGHVKRGCSCCNGSPEKPKMKKNVSKVEKSYKKLRTNISKRR